ncbi:hypothetical protein PHMEG_00027578 [Phytophthora megakarya]|uniref:DDE Tnp4 domain-containing protein n=1 Tax=Phytophthora megakarya TaxID=4795 RepID=A0A225V6U6_9STRA|nr:hypothetical protein PHMEG_00027578 [Phytophthora megakarya]
MVPFDERWHQRLTRTQRCYNDHLSKARILIECVFDKLKAHCKVLYGVTDRKKHTTNARGIRVAAIIHNLLIDIGDKLFNVKRNEAK